jgi:hypothetical protein
VATLVDGKDRQEIAPTVSVADERGVAAGVVRWLLSLRTSYGVGVVGERHLKWAVVDVVEHRNV